MSYAGQSFTWDGLDRMISNQSSYLTWSYLYDASGERIAKIPPTGGWTFTIRNVSKQVTTEYSGTSASRDNVFLGNQLALSYANAAIGGSGPVWTFYAADHLGTPRLINDIGGNTVEARRYWPYGDAVAPQGTFEALRFATMEFDAEGGTSQGLASDRYYDHARSHVGGLARFLSPDVTPRETKGPEYWNRYIYASNNPLRHVDTNGFQSADLYSRDPNVAYLRGQITRDQLVRQMEDRAPLAAGVAVGVAALFAPEIAASVAIRGIPVLSPLAGRITDFFENRPVLLGETMGRVETVGSEMQAGSFATSFQHVSQMLAENLKWLQGRIEGGARVFDIGINPARVGGRSPFFGSEVSLLVRNGYHRVFSHLVTINDQVYKVYEWVRSVSQEGAN